MGCCGEGSKGQPVTTIRFKPSKDMGCRDCGTANEYNIGVCRCCELVDKDTGQKEVNWCTFCKAFICRPCSENYPKRAQAFFLDVVSK